MRTPSHEETVEFVRETTRNLFDTMMSGELVSQPAFQTSTVEDRDESVFCLIGFSGDFVGSGSLHCTGNCAKRLASALLMTEYSEVDEEVLDAIAEITNMIVGNVKTALEDSLGVIGISTPTVIFGRQYAARNFGASEWTVVPFTVDGDAFDVRISLQPNKEIQRILDRHSLRQPSAN